MTADQFCEREDDSGFIKARVAFIDDDGAQLESRKRSFYRHRDRWQMFFFSSARKALQAHHAKPFDVVVTDILMPEMDGIELIIQLNRSHTAPHCIVLTGMSDLQLATQVFNRCNLFRFYTKPCVEERLAEAITAALVATEPMSSREVQTTTDASVPVERVVLDRLSRPMLVVDAKARQCYMNQAATALLAQSHQLLRIDHEGVLRGVCRDDTRHIHQALARLLATPDEEMSALTLRGNCGQGDLKLVMVQVSLAGRAVTRLSDRHALLFIADSTLQQPGTPSTEMIAAILGVTATEARLIDQLAQGHDLDTAARQLGVTSNSVRTYLKRVLRKTGLNRQVDLVRLVMTIPLP
ncbi:MAG: response regulator [Marinobacterium sp.]|nr:response regulator [Marinobacterium sp.]